MSETAHQDLIRDQFTRQATVFNAAAPVADKDALQLIVTAANAEPDDTVLDVACGGGLVARAFAPHVRHATGIDVTPAMLDTARKAAAEQGLANTSWDQGDVTTLPYADGAFTIVATRFSFHHFLDPLAVLREMARVCAPGGRIVVADSCPSEDAAKAAAFNRLELLRDPSHTRALPLSEMKPHSSPKPGSASRTSSFTRAARRGREQSARALVPQPRRRGEDHRDVSRVRCQRQLGHPGAARRRGDPLRLPGCHRRGDPAC